MRVKIKAISYVTKAGENLLPYTSVELPLDEAREVLSAGVADAEGWDQIGRDDGGPDVDTDVDGLLKGDTLTDGPPAVPPDGFLANGEPADGHDPVVDGKFVGGDPDGNADKQDEGKPRRGRPSGRDK